MKEDFGNLIKITGLLISTIFHPTGPPVDLFPLVCEKSICTILLPTPSSCHLIKPGQAHNSQRAAP